MEIEASHYGRANVRIAVSIKRPQVTSTNDAWSARVVFTLEAGEQLTSVARDLAARGSGIRTRRVTEASNIPDLFSPKISCPGRTGCSQ
jgi:hypothetical protein